MKHDAQFARAIYLIHQIESAMVRPSIAPRTAEDWIRRMARELTDAERLVGDISAKYGIRHPAGPTCTIPVSANALVSWICEFEIRLRDLKDWAEIASRHSVRTQRAAVVGAAG